MKARKIGMFAGTFGALLLSTQAMAVFNPPPGADELKLVDGSGFFAPTNGTPTTGTPLPRSDAFPGPGGTYVAGEIAALNQPYGSGGIVGVQDYTAFNITSLLVNGNPLNLPAGTKLTGVTTFIQVDAVQGAFGNELEVQIGNQTGRGNTPAVDPAGGSTIGRFFIYDSTGVANAGSFSTTGGTDNDITYNGGTVSDGHNSFVIDTLPNFTSGTLLLTGSFISTDTDAGGDPVLDDILVGSNDPGVSWTGGITSTDIVVDGGAWYWNNLVPATGASFQIDQTGFDGTSDPTGSGHGDPGVYAGGWQVSSHDPVQFTAFGVPEPITAGLGSLALAALAGYSTRRRKA